MSKSGNQLDAAELGKLQKARHISEETHLFPLLSGTGKFHLGFHVGNLHARQQDPQQNVHVEQPNRMLTRRQQNEG